MEMEMEQVWPWAIMIIKAKWWEFHYIIIKSVFVYVGILHPKNLKNKIYVNL